MSDSLTRALRQLETPICPLQDTDARRRQDAQAAYVATWRAEHPSEVWGEFWPCPLCGRVIQADPLPYRVREHQLRHAPDWERYQAAGADRAPAGEGGIE